MPPKIVNSTSADTMRLRSRVAVTTGARLASKPSLGRALSKLNIVATKRYKTMATDGYNIFVNMKCADGLTDSEFVACLEHELLHIVFQHNDLRRMLDPNNMRPKRFNIAADCEINSHIEGLPVWVERPLYYGLPDGKGTKYYWENIKSQPKSKDDDASDDTDSSDSARDDSVSEDEDTLSDLPNDDNADDYDDDDSVESDSIDDEEYDDEEDHILASDEEDIGFSSALSDEDMANIATDYNLSGTNTVQDIVNEKLNERVITTLLRMIQSKQTAKFSRMVQARNNRSFFGRSVTTTRQKPYALYLDISGSMAGYWRFFQSLVDQVSVRDVSYIGMFDINLHDYDPKHFGGGTDMTDVANHAKANGYIPIVFTDGYYSHVDMPKETVYVLTQDHSQFTDYGNKKYVLNLVGNNIAQ